MGIVLSINNYSNVRMKVLLATFCWFCSLWLFVFFSGLTIDFQKLLRLYDEVLLKGIFGWESFFQRVSRFCGIWLSVFGKTSSLISLNINHRTLSSNKCICSGCLISKCSKYQELALMIPVQREIKRFITKLFLVCKRKEQPQHCNEIQFES